MFGPPLIIFVTMLLPQERGKFGFPMSAIHGMILTIFAYGGFIPGGIGAFLLFGRVREMGLRIALSVVFSLIYGVLNFALIYVAWIMLIFLFA